MSSGGSKKWERSRGPGFVCVFCDKYFSGTSIESIHIRRHIHEKPYNCQFCDYSAVCASDVAQHERNVHSSKDIGVSYKCSKCTKTFQLLIYLENHFRTYHYTDIEEVTVPKEEIKEEINYESSNTDPPPLQTTPSPPPILLAPPLPIVLSTPPPIVLPPPSKILHPPQGRSTYRQNSVNICEFCHKKFRLNSTLVTHRRTHTGERPYNCEYCGKGFAQKSNFNQHVRRHLGEKRFGCNFCDKRFITRQHAQSHTEALHGVKGPVPRTPVETVTEVINKIEFDNFILPD